MVLRRMELLGFKSFPDKTVIELGPGISAVVGPNGSGKSNITDAIRWVLGEVSARALRGQRMEDVIFAGAPGRRAVPLAEVTLILDNAEGTLPLPFGEVSVTRRVDRSGASDYLINRSPCRLRDVVDLFAGTGLGRNAYAIVGQGEVDEVLRARPPERRALVEEAAGITRFRQRLHEGDRRLAGAADCEQRLADLLGERERALGSLARQADLAERHGRASDELRRVELRLWARDWRAARGEHDSAAAEASATSAEHDALADDLAAVAAEQRGLAAEGASARAALEAEAAACREAERALERARQQVSLAAGLGAGAEAEAARAGARGNELTERAASQAAEAARGEQAAAEAREGLRAASAAEAEARTALAEASRRRSLAASSLARAQAALGSCRQAVAAATGGGPAAAVEAARRAAEAGEARAAEARAEADRAAAEAERARAAGKPAESAAALQQREAALLRAHRDALAAAAGSLRSRVQVLAEVAASGAGYAQGARTALAGKRRGDPAFAGVIGALGELIHVPPHLSAAIAAALGGAVGDIVTESADAAERAIAGLKASRGGRATFLPLDTLRAPTLPPDQRRLGQADGALGWAADLVTSAPAVAPAVRHALGRVLVARDLAAARRLAGAAGYRLRVVTLEGDVVHPGGAMSGGAVRGERSAGLIGRDQERRRLSVRLDALAGDLSRVEAALSRAMATASEAEGLAAAARRALAEAEAVARAARGTAAAAERERDRLAGERDGAEERLRQQGQADPAALAAAERAAAGEVEAATSRLAAAEGEEAALREAATAARIALATAQQRLAAAEEAAARLAREARELQSRVAEAEADRARALEAARTQRVAGSEAATVVAAQEQALREAEGRRVQAGERVAAVQAQAAQAAERREWAERERERMSGILRRAEGALAKADAALAALAARLETAHGLPLEALADVTPSERPGADRERAAALRRELAAIGGVRPEAVAEHRAEQAALAELRAGVDDVRQARADLQAWAAEMEVALTDRYAEALAAVRRQFAAVYGSLSGGGKADLVPVWPATPDGPAKGGDAAAPGLEIVAQPPGKQLAHMGLLSGGERALVAIALVLAFLRVRPAAFCVLDEIEAALDDANVGRCAAYLREVAESTQIIVVTHQKGTMEVADRLVGVTMGDPGVSRLLTVRLAG